MRDLTRTLAVPAMFCLLGAALATPSAAAEPRPKPAVMAAVQFEAQPSPPEEMAEKTVSPGEPFMRRRLVALQSATLQADVIVAARGDLVAFAKGTRMLLALGRQRETFYCATYVPGGLPAWAGGAYKVQWMCFLDADGDKVFETAYLTPDNAGAYLPSFAMVQEPRPVQGAAAYSLDATADRTWYETAVVHQKTFNIYNLLFFYTKVRREGEEAWRDVASITRGVSGGYTSVPSKLPQRVHLGASVFTVTAKAGQTVTVKPETQTSGVMSFGISTSFSRR